MAYLRRVGHLVFSLTLLPLASPDVAAQSSPGPDRQPAAHAAADPVHDGAQEALLRATVAAMADLGAVTVGGVPLESGRLLAEFYAARGYRLAWQGPQQVGALLRVVQDSAADGLDPADYHLPTLGALAQAEGWTALTPAARLGADLQLSDALLRYSYHIRFGRLDPEVVNHAWNHRQAIPAQTLIASMQQVLAAADTGAALDALAPRPFFYSNLKRGLREYSGSAVLNEPVSGSKSEQIRMNLERLRWLYDDLPGDYVLVDVGGFMAHVVRAGQIDWSTRVIVGTPEAQTPSFRDEMEHVVFNPTWTVPPSIQKKMRGVSSRFKVLDRRTGRAAGGANVSDTRRVSLVQGPGPTNALGRVKFIFPNDQAVYLHDTLSKGLFGQSVRAYSHGCVRVQNPLKLAEIILNRAHWDQGEIKRVVASNKTRYVLLEQRLPVLLYYLTARADEHGKVAFSADIYGRDPALRRALKGPPSDLRIRFAAAVPLVDPAAAAAVGSGATPVGTAPAPARSMPQVPVPTPVSGPAPRPTLTRGGGLERTLTREESRVVVPANAAPGQPGARL